jgi:hypothetical protein
MNNKFNKSDLETGMRVKTANGNFYIVVKNYQSKNYGFQDVMFFNFNGGFCIGDSYADDLSCQDMSDYDIIFVYSKSTDGEFLDKNADVKTLWDRNQKVVEMTISEIETSLGIKNLKVIAE